MRQKAVREPIATWWRVEIFRQFSISPVRVVEFAPEFVVYITGDRLGGSGAAHQAGPQGEVREDAFSDQIHEAQRS